MRRTSMVRVAAAVTGLVAAVGVGIGSGSTPAGACSFAGPRLVAPATAEAGGFLRVEGAGLFRIEGDVESDCGGDYEILPLTDAITFEVVFTRSGRQERRVATAPVVAGEHQSDFGASAVFVVPVDATSATVDVLEPEVFGTQTVQISGSTPTTTPANATPQAPAADPVGGTGTYTG